jgi:oligopeptide/dipeptide ABC transporter ATP-binding protein
MLRCYLFGDESAFGWISNIGQFKMQNYILEVEGLVTRFFTRQGVVHAVDDVSFCMPPATTVALVGESGSGKSVTGLSIMRLIPPPGRIVSGEIRFNGQNLLELDDDSMRRIRGREIAMIFQDPMTSLNPVFTVGHQIAEVLCTHEGLGKKQASERSIELLDLVRIGNPRRRAADYPHQLSGGMRQRVMIAIALCCNPKLLIADEPTTALDVTIQAEILDLLARLKEEFKVSLLLITHDLGVVAEVADRVEVMYAGQIMEQAPVRDIFDRPAHPYTEGLLKSIPRLDRDGQAPARLATIDGAVPSLIDLEEGCRFANRCSYRIDQCSEGPIPLAEPSPGRLSRCIRSEVVGSLR